MHTNLWQSLVLVLHLQALHLLARLAQQQERAAPWTSLKTLQTMLPRVRTSVAGVTSLGSPDCSSPGTPVGTAPAVTCPGAPRAVPASALPQPAFQVLDVLGAPAAAELAKQPVMWVPVQADGAARKVHTSVISVSPFGPMPLSWTAPGPVLMCRFAHSAPMFARGDD
jgi:hypothetical protein